MNKAEKLIIALLTIRLECIKKKYTKTKDYSPNQPRDKNVLSNNRFL
nr:MAG TPA: hypothetical protein [Caudoviricetes sp.]